MKLVLTGGTGYVGSALMGKIKALHDTGYAIDVRALVRNPKNSDFPDFVTIMKGSLENIPQGLIFEEPHVVVHMGVKQIDHDGLGFKEVNVQGTKNLLSACNSNTQGIIYGSTLSVLGQQAQTGVGEAEPIDPQTPLAESRAEAERLIMDAMKQRNRWAYCLRPRFILDVNDQFVLPGIRGLVAKGLYIGNGKQRFSVISVNDYTDVIVQVMKKIVETKGAHNAQQMPLNVGYSEPISFDFIYFCFFNCLDEPVRIKKIPMPSWLPKLAKKIKNEKFNARAVQLELIGFDHFGNVAGLEKIIGLDITRQESQGIVKRIIGEIVRQRP